MTVKNKVNAAADSEVCCPLFHPGKWDGIEQVWEGKLFLKDWVPELFHIPLPGSYRRVISAMWKKAGDSGAAPAANDFLLLMHDLSPFKGELYLSVTREIPGQDVVALAGRFFSKVFEGNYGDIRKCIRKMYTLLDSNEVVSVKDYIYFPYCPKCAKKYGHNYIVVVSQINEI